MADYSKYCHFFTILSFLRSLRSLFTACFCITAPVRCFDLLQKRVLSAHLNNLHSIQQKMAWSAPFCCLSTLSTKGALSIQRRPNAHFFYKAKKLHCGKNAVSVKLFTIFLLFIACFFLWSWFSSNLGFQSSSRSR